MTTKSNKVGTAKAVKTEETQANVIASNGNPQIVDWQAKVTEFTKGLTTICHKVEGLNAVEALNKLSAGNLPAILSLMSYQGMSDEKQAKLLKGSMEFLNRSITGSVTVKNDAGKTRQCKLDLKDDASAEALAYKALLQWQAVVIKAAAAVKASNLAIW